MSRLRVVLVEPWYGGGHRTWADALVGASRHEVHLVAHEASSWRWRVRGGAVTLAEQVEAVVARTGPPDVVLVGGDLVDVAALRTFARRALGSAPVALFLHENQVAVEVAPGERPEPWAAWTTWRSLLAADAVAVATDFHRDALGAALPALLDTAPDHGHHHRLAEVVAGIEVLGLPVPVAELVATPRPPADGGPPVVVWNQRWDDDKRPVALLSVLVALAEAGVDLRVALTGLRQHRHPPKVAELVAKLGGRVVVDAEQPPDAYREVLLASDVVVATARHEFFGVAPVEAMAAGCVALLPDRLAYPELVPVELHDAVLYRGQLFDRLRSVLEDVTSARRRVVGLREAMLVHDVATVVPRWDGWLDDVVARAAARSEGPAPRPGPDRRPC